MNRLKEFLAWLMIAAIMVMLFAWLYVQQEYGFLRVSS